MKSIYTIHKKVLSIFLSLALFLPVKSYASKIIDDETITLSSNINSDNDDDTSDIDLSKAMITMLSFFAISLTGLEIKDELEYQNDMKRSSGNFSEYFKNSAAPCRITKRQEGRMWCWLACLQGLLRYHNINKSQREIFKGISKSWFVPVFEHNRNSGLSIYSSEKNIAKVGKTGKNDHNSSSTIFPSMIKEYVEKISNNRLTYQILYLNKDLSNEGIKRTILDIYGKIRRPFSLLANHTSCGHFINITRIDWDRTMHIEDPAFEKGRTESIDSYVRNFDSNVKSMVNSANGILLGFVTEKENSFENSYSYSKNFITADSIQ